MNTRFQSLDDVLKTEIKKGTLKGGAMFVEQHGSVLFDEVYGTDKSDSIYKIYSMTKPITLVALMILYERGLLTLQDPASMYIPELGSTMVSTQGGLVPQTTVMTVQHLLDMQSGIVYPGENTLPEVTMTRLQKEMRERIAAGEKLGNLEICRILATCPLEFQPGRGYRYGASADMIGAIVEIISGMKFSDFLKKEIFEPLNMTDTFFAVPKDKLNRLAIMYHRDPVTRICSKPEAEQIEWLGLTDPTRYPNIESGGGGLYSTMKDYCAFCRMLLNNGVAADGRRILSRKTMELLPTSNLTDQYRNEWLRTGLAGYGYGNLLRIMEDTRKAGGGSIGEYGWDGLPGCYFMIDPSEDLFTVFMQQIGEGADQNLRRRYRQAIYAALD